MIPYYYRISRFAPKPGEFKVSAISPIRRLQDHSVQTQYPVERDQSSPSGQTSKKNQLQKNEIAQNQEDFTLLQLPQEPLPLIAERDPWGHYAKQTIHSQAAQILAVFESHETSTHLLLWALLFSNWLNAPLKILSLQNMVLEDQLLEVIKTYHAKRHTGDLLKIKPTLELVQTDTLEMQFQDQAQHHPTSLGILSSQSVTLRKNILHNSHCPLLWIPKNASDIQITNILVAVASKHPSLHIIQQGLTLSQLFGANLHLVHISDDKIHEEEAEVALDKLGKVINWQGVQHDTFVDHGDVSQTIHAYVAKEKINLIVMGTHHFAPAQTGSISETIISQENIPVFVVHPYQN